MRSWIIALAIGGIFAGCGEGSSGDGKGGANGGFGGSGGSGGTGLDPSSCEHDPVQLASQPCCPDHGADACGAGLFCAAFDGRKTHSCYLERSRLGGEECREDRHCLSNSCNQETATCRVLPGEACSSDGECAPDSLGKSYGCEPQSGSCFPIGDGSLGSECANDNSCIDGAVCVDLACELPPGVCGPGDGTGPCSQDPASAACMACRLTVHEACVSTCSDSFSAFMLCLIEHCPTPDGPLDHACVRDECDAQLCENERCENRCGGSQGCY